jgi:hypothetical protein
MVVLNSNSRKCFRVSYSQHHTHPQSPTPRTHTMEMVRQGILLLSLTVQNKVPLSQGLLCLACSVIVSAGVKRKTCWAFLPLRYPPVRRRSLSGGKIDECACTSINFLYKCVEWDTKKPPLSRTQKVAEPPASSFRIQRVRVRLPGFLPLSLFQQRAGCRDAEMLVFSPPLAHSTPEVSH